MRELFAKRMKIEAILSRFCHHDNYGTAAAADAAGLGQSFFPGAGESLKKGANKER